MKSTTKPSRPSRQSRALPALLTAATATATTLLLPASGAAAPSDNPKSPIQNPKSFNVLFIASYDMNTRIGAYGDTHAITPNLDALAKRSVRFERAFCQYPLCSPSRTSLLTGLRPDYTRVFDLKTHFRKFFPDIITLPQLFKNNGYVTNRVGKIYHYGVPKDIGTPGLDDPASWNDTANPAGRDKTDENKIIRLKGSLGSGMSYLIADGTDEEQTDGMVATQAIKWLEQNRDRPFFIAAGFFRPHVPYVAPKKYYDMHPLASIVLAPQHPDVSKVPADALASTKPFPFLGATPEQQRLAIRGYYASMSFVDAQIGRVIDALDRLGLADNTIIVFWGDNGFNLGEHGLWQKQSLFDPASRIPLFIAVPPGVTAAKTAGKSSPAQVELVDLYPTLADLAGLKPPPGLQGVSLRPLLENPDAPWSHPAFMQVRDGRGMRTDEWFYAEWGADATKGRELYDLRNDPKELNNLAEDPARAALVAQLSQTLRAAFIPLKADPKAKAQGDDNDNGKGKGKNKGKNKNKGNDTGNDNDTGNE